MTFLSEIGRNGVLYSSIWPRHESNRYIYQKEYIAIIPINQIEKRDINDIPIYNCALRACYVVSNRIELKNISINQIDKI